MRSVDRSAPPSFPCPKQTHTQTHTHAHARTRTRTHTHAHTHTHTHTHSHRQTDTHTRTDNQPCPPIPTWPCPALHRPSGPADPSTVKRSHRVPSMHRCGLTHIPHRGRPASSPESSVSRSVWVGGARDGGLLAGHAWLNSGKHGASGLCMDSGLGSTWGEHRSHMAQPDVDLQHARAHIALTRPSAPMHVAACRPALQHVGPCLMQH
jgi:hypothetical protein